MIKVVRDSAAGERPKVVMEEVTITDPEERARRQARRERFRRNLDWFSAHAPEIYSQYRGKHLCIAGEELFAADSVEEAVALAEAAHPEDDGQLVRYIPREKRIRI
jgi:hypothetical protein